MPKLATTADGHTEEGAVCAVVRVITRTPQGTLLRAEGPAGEQVVRVVSEPDDDGARRRLAAYRRIDRVEFHVSGDRVGAVIRGKRHRLPFAGPVPVAVALGLTELGIGTTIFTGAS